MLEFFFDWLAGADSPAPADAIFVLAGHKSRKVYAIELFEQGRAPRLLLSVGRFEIRRFPELGLPPAIDLLQMVQSIPPAQRHFFVLYENRQFTVERMPVRALGTLSEIDALADWLAARPQISSLLVVSSAPHLRRLRICCRALLPLNVKTAFLAASEESAALNPQNWWKDAVTRKNVLSEWIKIPCYLVFLPLWKWARPWRSRKISSSSH